MEELPSPENIESQIEQLLEELGEYALDQFFLPKENEDALADEWYDVEMEARVSGDRSVALEHLQRFIFNLKHVPKKSP